MPPPMPRQSWTVRYSPPARWQPSSSALRVGHRIGRFEVHSRSDLRDPFASKCFSPCRCLHNPLRLLSAGASVAGRYSHPQRGHFCMPIHSGSTFRRRTRDSLRNNIGVEARAGTWVRPRINVQCLHMAVSRNLHYLGMAKMESCNILVFHLLNFCYTIVLQSLTARF